MDGGTYNIPCAVGCEQWNVLYSLCRRVGTVERVIFSVPQGVNSGTCYILCAVGCEH